MFDIHPLLSKAIQARLFGDDRLQILRPESIPYGLEKCPEDVAIGAVMLPERQTTQTCLVATPATVAQPFHAFVLLPWADVFLTLTAGVVLPRRDYVLDEEGVRLGVEIVKRDGAVVVAAHIATLFSSFAACSCEIRPLRCISRMLMT